MQRLVNVGAIVGGLCGVDPLQHGRSAFTRRLAQLAVEVEVAAGLAHQATGMDSEAPTTWPRAAASNYPLGFTPMASKSAISLADLS